MYSIFCDGFDDYATIADLGKKWTTYGGNGLTLRTTGRRDSKCLGFGGNLGNYAKRAFPPSSHVVAGAAFRLPYDYPCNLLTFGGFFNAAVALLYQPGGGLYAVRKTGAYQGDIAVLAVSALGLFNPLDWNYIEFGAVLDSNISIAGIEARINGLGVAIQPTNIQTIYADSLASWVGVGGMSIGDNSVWSIPDIDDFYVTYGDEQKWCGDSRVINLPLSGNSTPQDWTPDEGTAYERLRDRTGYIEAEAIGSTSVFDIDNLGETPDVIHALQVHVNLNKSTDGDKAAALLCKSGSDLDEGDTFPVALTNTVRTESYTVDPATGLAWSESGINGAKVGVRIKA